MITLNEIENKIKQVEYDYKRSFKNNYLSIYREMFENYNYKIIFCYNKGQTMYISKQKDFINENFKPADKKKIFYLLNKEKIDKIKNF